MAEGLEVALPPSTQRYFCHLCVQEVSAVYPDLICSRCHSGFIEEVPREPEELQSDESDIDIEAIAPEESNIGDLIRRTVRRTILGLDRNPDDLQYHPFIQLLRRDLRPTVRENESDSEPRIILPILSDMDDDDGHLDFHQLFQLASNFGDYAFGSEWDAIITEILNETDVAGVPPLPKEQIETIPSISVTKEHVDKGVQCTVCMEDFTLGEKVKNLPCEHFFHKDCIIPWLEMHATCPICRKEINGEEEEKVERPPRRRRLRNRESSVESSSTGSQESSSSSSPPDQQSSNSSNRSEFNPNYSWNFFF